MTDSILAIDDYLDLQPLPPLKVAGGGLKVPALESITELVPEGSQPPAGSYLGTHPRSPH